MVVDAAEEEGLEAGLGGEEGGLGGAVAEGVDLPADLGLHAELLGDEAVPVRGLVHHVDVVSRRLILHNRDKQQSGDMGQARQRTGRSEQRVDGRSVVSAFWL